MSRSISLIIKVLKLTVLFLYTWLFYKVYHEFTILVRAAVCQFSNREFDARSGNTTWVIIAL